MLQLFDWENLYVIKHKIYNHNVLINFLKQMDIKLLSEEDEVNKHPKFPEQIYLPP